MNKTLLDASLHLLLILLNPKPLFDSCLATLALPVLVSTLEPSCASVLCISVTLNCAVSCLLVQLSASTCSSCKKMETSAVTHCSCRMLNARLAKWITMAHALPVLLVIPLHV